MQYTIWMLIVALLFGSIFLITKCNKNKDIVAVDKRTQQEKEIENYLSQGYKLEVREKYNKGQAIKFNPTCVNKNKDIAYSWRIVSEKSYTITIKKRGKVVSIFDSDNDEMMFESPMSAYDKDYMIEITSKVDNNLMTLLIHT